MATKLGDARERLLQGARVLFAREGLEGATTRAIAEEAGVNEVTLFRLFGTKKRLLAAVVEDTFAAEDAGLRKEGLSQCPQIRSDLRSIVDNFVCTYRRALEENYPLIRSLIGGIHKHQEHRRQVARGVFEPLRKQFVERLTEARRRGLVRRGPQLELAADVLAGQVFAGVMKRQSKLPVEYTWEEYDRFVLDLFVGGLQPASARPKKVSKS